MKKLVKGLVCLVLAVSFLVPTIPVSAASKGVTAEEYYERIAEELELKGESEASLVEAGLVEEGEFPIEGDYLTRTDVAVLANRIYLYTKKQEFLKTYSKKYDKDTAALVYEFLERAEFQYEPGYGYAMTQSYKKTGDVYASVAPELRLVYESKEDEKFYKLLDNKKYGWGESIEVSGAYGKKSFFYDVAPSDQRYYADNVYGDGFGVDFSGSDGAWLRMVICTFEGGYNISYGLYENLYAPLRGDKILERAMTEIEYVKDIDGVPGVYQGEVVSAIALGLFKGYKVEDSVEFRGTKRITEKGSESVLAIATGEKKTATVARKSIVHRYYDEVAAEQVLDIYFAKYRPERKGWDLKVHFIYDMTEGYVNEEDWFVNTILETEDYVVDLDGYKGK